MLIYAFKLLRRAIKKAEDETVTARMIHKMLAVSILVSYKFIEETTAWTLVEFSKLAGVSTKELEQMELAFVIEMLGFEVSINSTDLVKTKKCLIAYSKLK